MNSRWINSLIGKSRPWSTVFFAVGTGAFVKAAWDVAHNDLVSAGADLSFGGLSICCGLDSKLNDDESYRRSAREELKHSFYNAGAAVCCLGVAATGFLSKHDGALVAGGLFFTSYGRESLDHYAKYRVHAAAKTSPS